MGLEETPKEDNLERKEGKLRENLRELSQLGWREVSRWGAKEFVASSLTFIIMIVLSKHLLK